MHLSKPAFYTLGGCRGKVVAQHVDGYWVDSLPNLHRFLLCQRRSRGTAHESGDNGQSIGYAVSDANKCPQLDVSDCNWELPIGLLQQHCCKQLIINPTIKWLQILLGETPCHGRLFTFTILILQISYIQKYFDLYELLLNWLANKIYSVFRKINISFLTVF